ncbi:MAG: YqgE/AlgH family protein [Deltaproteobacteria bacterium]|nr:YqgE/AlgH family protein [Deltaproteobacteria bacterium]
MDLAPSLLISVPQMRDPNFDHTVVLVLEHDEHGSFGLVVNRETRHTLGEFCRSQEIDYRGVRDAKVLYGGPVGPTQGFVLYGQPHELVGETAGREIVERELWFGADLALLEQLAGQRDTPYRLLVGYAGWAPGQLDAELAAGAWLARPVDPALLFRTPPEEVWPRALGDLGIAPGTIVVHAASNGASGDASLN